MPARAFPYRLILRRVALGGALLAGLLWLTAAPATSLYRCTGAGGEVVFSSSSAGYAGCRKLSSYAPARAAKAPAAAHRSGKTAVARALRQAPLPVAAWPAERPGFAGVQGSVQTTARSIAPPPAASSGRSGRWDYRQSPQPPQPSVAAAPSAPAVAGDRVLRGAVYRVVRGDGSVEYTNLPPHGQRGRGVTMLFSYIATCMACNLHSPINWNSVRLNFSAYASTIHAASAQYGVDEAFLRAIIHAESAFNPRALSLKGAQGLMQLMPATASDMGVLDAFDAEQNIRGGARYLALLLRSFNGSEQLAAAAYNAGPGAVQRYNGVPPYDETRVYVQRVGTLRKRYGEAAHAPLAAVREAASRSAGAL